VLPAAAIPEPSSFHNSSIRAEDGTCSSIIGATTAGQTTADMAAGFAKNNYGRPDGQNVGNFLTDRSSSRVLAPPGGGSSIVFGDCSNTTAATPAKAVAAGAGSLADIGAGTPDRNANNYARPQGQNVGNFLTDRHAVKVHAPPGGTSQITFG
jgi:SPIRAL1-like protein